MSEAEILQVLQSIKDKQLADLIRSHMTEPTEIKLLLIMAKLGIITESGKVNLIIPTNANYEERGLVFQILGGVIIDGVLYVLQLVYNSNLQEARIQLVQQDSMILQFIEIGEQNENEKD